MLVKIIKILHILLILYIVLSVVIPNKQIKEYSLVLLLYLLFQYITNFGKCGLTQLEYYFMGEKYEEGFMYRLINPVLKVSEVYFENYLFLLHIIYIVILSYQLDYF